MRHIPDECLEYLSLAELTLKEIRSKLENRWRGDDPSVSIDEAASFLKGLFQCVTLGVYLKDRFDNELMDNLEAYNKIKKIN